MSIVPMFMPETVKVTPAELGEFHGTTLHSTAASYEKDVWNVDTRLAIVATTLNAVPDPAGTEHEADVTDIHDVVKHCVEPTVALADKLLAAKFVPTIVTVDVADRGAFGLWSCVITGASNVKTADLVPTCAASVTAAWYPDPEPPYPSKHCTDVEEDHEVVMNCDEPSRAVIVTSVTAKLKPKTVTLRPPVVAAFGWSSAVTIGALKENTAVAVPTNVEIVADIRRLIPYPCGARQSTEVPVLHDEVVHTVVSIRTIAVTSTGPKFIPPTVTEPLAVEGML